MQPGLSSLFLFVSSMSSLSQRLCSLILAFLVCFALYGCVTSGNPPKSVLKEALETQIELAHRSLDNSLDLQDGSTEIISVKVDSSSYLEDDERRFLSISGYVDIRPPGFKEKTNTPFLLYLERGVLGESWSLVKPSLASNGLSKEWVTYPLGIE